uniref:AT-rich interactive domain-containing protein 4B n=1 Tax=Lygus hesperus TaxID=30085 RepID=A0A146M3D2_LYGHE
MADEPPSLPVGTGVSAKYKGAFCEAKIRKVVRSVKCKVLFKNGLGSYTVGDDQIKGTIRTGAVVEVRHPEKKEYSEATITKIQDCSQYTVVFDDGDITTLRRTALCLKSGKHFAESETLDQLPLTHPEHFSTPVIGGRRGRRTRIGASEASSDEDESFHQSNDFSNFKETDIGRVVCVEGGEKRKNRDNWFPGLIVAPTAQESVPIRVRDEYLVRSFKDGRYYTVPKKEIMEFTREMGAKAETNSLKTAVEKALQFLDRDELPLHWDRDLLLYGVTDPGSDSDPGEDNESSDDEPREKKDHFVAQLYKFMDENGTPINEEPVIGSKDVDLFRLYKVVHNLGGFNRVTNQNNWKNVSVKLGFGPNPVIVGMVKQSYRKYLLSFEEWPKRPGCSMQIQPRLSRSRSRIGRSNVIKDRSTSSPTIKIEKDKTADKSFPTLSETANLKETMAKPAAVKEVTPATPVPKDKPVNKKSAQHATPPIQVKVETAIKTPAREIKVETGLKLRNPKYKIVEPEPIIVKKEGSKEDNNESEAVSENIIAASKDKKKRITTKDKQKKDVPIVKGGKVDCLANTRQKRVIKERLKTTESIKGRSKASTTVIAEVEKSHPSKTKTKDEGTVMTKIKKEETTPTSAVSDEKRKGRKKKEKSEITLENYDVLPTYKTISLGDKLKVYYGPTKEAKITSYEAKVLSTKEENGETLYFVHYTGWNTRYDEWIRANRIADNLSWVAGKASKKQTQVPTPKSAKKEKKPNKSDNSKGECKAGSHKDVTGSSSCGSSLSSSKDHQSNRQGSVGRSTTPSSIASSSSRSKGPTHKRPTTRAAQTKKDDETTQEFDSDGGSELEESKMIALVHSENMDLNTLSQSKNNKHEPSSRDEILSVVGITLKEEEEEDE